MKTLAPSWCCAIESSMNERGNPFEYLALALDPGSN
jgi:hypothetical protein